MKKLVLLCASFLIIASSFASFNVVLPKLRADQTYVPIGKTGKKISLLELSTIHSADLEKITGRKMGFLEKFSFRITQKKLKKSIKADGTIDNKKLNKFLSKRDGDTGFHVGGFALGFFLGLIGVLIAYLINDDYKHNRVKWAWIGFGIEVALYLLLVAVVLSSVSPY